MASSPPTLDFGPHRGQNIPSIAFAFIAISGVILALRFWSRALQHEKKFGRDDWTALIAWPFISATNVLVYEWYATAGLGYHEASLPPSYIARGLKMLMAGELTYNFGMSTIRISVALLYHRLFTHVSKDFRIACWATVAVNVAWCLVNEPLTIWQCNPPRALWDRHGDYTCLPPLSLQLNSGITSILLDIWILIMPLPILWKLKLKPLKKAMLTIVFIMGYSVVFVTIGRLATIFVLGKSLDTDTFWAFTIMANWYLCEMFVAHISISLPAIFHLVIRVTKHGFSSLFTDREFSNSLPRYGTSITKSRSYDRAGFARLAPEQTWPRTKVILRLDELANENKSLP